MIIRHLLTIAILFAVFSLGQTQSNSTETHSVYFQFGSAALSEETQINLYQLRKELAQNTDSYQLEIHAHTDNIGSLEDNIALSEHRAKAVADYLIGKGMEASIIKQFTYGEEAPKSDNNLVSGRRENRRVDVKIYYHHTTDSQPRNYSYQPQTSNIEQLPTEWINKQKKIQEEAAKHLEAAAQIFDIDPKSDTLIVAKNGTAIYIPANTFEPLADENKITIVLNEIYKKSDMILTNFTTSADGKTLESGGMVNIIAMDGGKEYSKPLKHDISFFFPTMDMRGDMDLFFGQSDVNGNVDWVLSGRNISDYEGFKDPNAEEEDYTGNYFENLGLKKRCRIANPESNVICINQAMIGMMGNNLSAICVEDCPMFWCGMERIFFKKTYYAKRKAQIMACLESFLKRNKLMNSMSEGDLAELSAEVERRYGNNSNRMREAVERRKEEIFENAFDGEKTNMAAMNFYVSSVPRLGGINIDLFPRNPNPPQSLTFEIPKDIDKINTKLIFKQRNSVLNASSVKGGKIKFNNIPTGSYVCLVAIDYSNEKPRLAIQNILVGRDEPKAIVFQEYESEEALKKELQKLDS